MMITSLFLLFLLSLCVVVQMRIVETQYGSIRGKEDEGVISFLGVPFAHPPLGRFRFQPPFPLVRPWIGIRNATDSINAGSEDCLYLDIHVPKYANKSAVLYWIPSGNSKEDYNYVKEFVNRGDVIIVIGRYRVGIFGFAYLDPEIPANIGMLDQKFGFEWIRNNIGFFGGDPDRITIGGNGIHALLQILLIENDVNLFLHLQQPLAPEVMMIEADQAYERTMQLLDLLDCESIECLLSKSDTDILEVEAKMNNDIAPLTSNLFIPTVDGKTIRSSLMEMIKALAKRRKLAVLIGHDEHLSGSHFYTAKSNLYENDFRDILLRIFPSDSIHLINTIEYVYTNWSLPEESRNFSTSLVDLISDSHFICPMHDVVNTITKAFATFRYTFSPGKSKESGLDYIFGQPLRSQNHSKIQKNLSEFMINVWSNFIKTSHPTKESQNLVGWPEYKLSTRYQLLIHPELTRIISYYEKNSGKCALWNQFIPNGRKFRDCSSRNYRLSNLKRPRSDKLDTLSEKANGPTLNKDSMVVSYKLRVLNNQSNKSVFQGSGNSPIYILKPETESLPPTTTIASVRDNYFRKFKSGREEDFHRSQPVYDPFLVQDNSVKNETKKLYYPNYIPANS